MAQRIPRLDVVPVLPFHSDRDRRRSHEHGRLKGTTFGFEPESWRNSIESEETGVTASSSYHMEKIIEQVVKKEDNVPSGKHSAQRPTPTGSCGRRFGPSGRHRDGLGTRPHRDVDFDTSRSYHHSRRRSTRSFVAKRQVDGKNERYLANDNMRTSNRCNCSSKC